MSRVHNLCLLLTGGALALVPALIAAQKPATDAPQKIRGSQLLSASEMKWEPLEGLEGALQVPLWGDPTKEAHRVLYKFPAGTKVPAHTHTHGDRGMVVSGTLALSVDGGPVKRLPAGSYFSLAGGTKHTTSVEGETPCVFYLEREGPFDVVMVEEAGAKK